MARPSTPLLSRAKITNAALEAVRKTGGFTIPGIAADLGVHPSSLYHHVQGGRAEIVRLVRSELYAAIPIAALGDSTTPWQARLASWMREYRATTAAAASFIPTLVQAPVDDADTIAVYEALFVVLSDAGVPAAEQAGLGTMIDSLVLGSAIDALSPVPLWRTEGADAPALRRAVHEHDTESRAIDGLETGIRLTVAAIEQLVGSGQSEA